MSRPCYFYAKACPFGDECNKTEFLSHSPYAWTEKDCRVQVMMHLQTSTFHRDRDGPLHTFKEVKDAVRDMEVLQGYCKIDGNPSPSREGGRPSSRRRSRSRRRRDSGGRSPSRKRRRPDRSRRRRGKRDDRSSRRRDDDVSSDYSGDSRYSARRAPHARKQPLGSVGEELRETQHASDRLARAMEDFDDSTKKFQREDGRELYDVVARAVTTARHTVTLLYNADKTFENVAVVFEDVSRVLKKEIGEGTPDWWGKVETALG